MRVGYYELSATGMMIIILDNGGGGAFFFFLFLFLSPRDFTYHAISMDGNQRVTAGLYIIYITSSTSKTALQRNAELPVTNRLF